MQCIVKFLTARFFPIKYSIRSPNIFVSFYRIAIMIPFSILLFVDLIQGADGGPLVCRTTNRWQLVGLARNMMSSTCSQRGKPNLYSKIQAHLQWLQDETGCKFKCRNGKCLYEKEQICDRFDDCGDNSDEEKPCSKYKFRPVCVEYPSQLCDFKG